MGATPILWIVHREPQRRAALARLAALPDGMPQGSPGDALFREAPTPDAIVLGLAGDLERELEFAHRVGPATRAARWILVGDADQLARARTLFDLLPATYLLDPPEMHALRDAIRSAAEGGGDLPSRFPSGGSETGFPSASPGAWPTSISRSCCGPSTPGWPRSPC